MSEVETSFWLGLGIVALIVFVAVLVAVGVASGLLKMLFESWERQDEGREE